MRQIASIQSLRALAALMVVVGHCQTEALVAAAKHGFAFQPLALLPWGAGVDLFFVISGFIMVVASERLFGQPGAAATFASRRIQRIVPLYALFTTVYVLIQFATHKPVGGGDVLASYLFWPQDVYRDGVLRPIFSLGWTLNYEMFFYALFSVAIVLPRLTAVAAVAALLIAGVAIGRLVALPPGPLAFWTQPIVLEFVLGMGIAVLWREGIRLPNVARLALAAFGLAVLVFDTMGSSHQASTWITPTDLWRLLGWGMPAAALVAAAAFARSNARLPRVLAWSVPLGDASYALYLVHPFVIGTLMRIYTVTGLAHSVGYWPFIGASIVIAIIAAFAVHRVFELPVARFLAAKRPDGRATGTDASRLHLSLVESGVARERGTPASSSQSFR